MSTPAEDPAKAASLRILRALDEAAAKLEAVERAHTAPIAVIGVGCRLPGGVRNAADFWRLLHSGIDATSEVPPDRWDVDELYDPDPEKPGKICSRRGGFLSGEVDRFDAAFFGISPREATTMDPQHRLLLEVAHEALDSANQLRDRFEENSTGVFIGLTNSDYSLLLKMAAGDRPLDHYFVTGTALNAAAGRISYLLGLRGPSVAIDSACSSSLVTVHLACQSLRSGECAMAVAGGVNLILTSDASAALSRTGLLAPDGRCKTFDASADGYTRSEGCAMVVLKRLDDAQRDGDPILALIRGSAVNQDGPSSGFTVPSGAAQRRLIKSALAAAKIAPADIDYVEAHGTGTLLGDPIEVGALGDVLSVGRPVDRPLLIGSVKTNLGHLESAAGVTGLIKVALSLWHREIPAHLHCRNPSSRIPWKDFPLQVVTTRQAWPERNRPLRAGVSSFGVSGTNAHVVLETAPAAPAAKEIPVPKRQFYGERYWGPPRASDAIGRDWLYAVEWISAARPCDAAASALASGAAVARHVETWLGANARSFADAAYGGMLDELERIAAGFARQAAEKLQDVSGDRLALHQRRLLARVREIAARPNAAVDPRFALQRLAAAVPAEVETTLLGRCGAALADVVRGEVDALALLFPVGESITATRLYRDAPTSQAANALVREVLAALAPAGRRLRVLEIGAGSGATTAAALAALAGRDVDYVFTDVSPRFVAEARTRPGVTARLLDIERDPVAQGFAPGSFDVVVAANVLHATSDVLGALARVRDLLAPSGALVLLEATVPLAFLDLIFGLTDGWWKFADHELRAAHPLLGRSQWTEALRAGGFEDVQALGFPVEAGATFAQQTVFVARVGAAEASAPWLVVADDAAELWREALLHAGATCEWARPDADFRAVLAQRGAWSGAIHAVAEAGEPLRSALALAQAAIDRPLPLFFVTREAMAIAAGDRVRGAASAGLWGFARTLAQEHPELRPVCLDLDAVADPAALAAEVLRPDGETQIAWRGSERKVARLGRSSLAEKNAETARVTADATYLVVGGLGGLGLPLARWLVERGARHVVLAGRSAPTADAEAALRALAVSGAEVRVERMDVAQEADVARVLAAIAATPWPLRGVVHAAGVLDDGIVRQLTWDRFVRVLGPKVAGAWHLHRMTQSWPLDWFIVFSSSTALFGSPGQVNHAAANASIEALVQQRRAAGLPGLAIAWGPWAEIGAAATGDIGARARAKGLGTISPAKGWRIFGRVFDAMPTQVAVVPVTWSETPAALTSAPFFSALRAAAPAAGVAFAPQAVERGFSADALAALAPKARVAKLRDEVRAQAAQVLGLAGPEAVDPAQGFFALGMDSLMAMELRGRLQQRLGRALPATLTFDHPTAEKAAAALAALWGASPKVASPAPPPPVSDKLDALSASELSGLLDEELKTL